MTYKTCKLKCQPNLKENFKNLDGKYIRKICKSTYQIHNIQSCIRKHQFNQRIRILSRNMLNKRGLSRAKLNSSLDLTMIPFSVDLGFLDLVW